MAEQMFNEKLDHPTLQGEKLYRIDYNSYDLEIAVGIYDTTPDPRDSVERNVTEEERRRDLSAVHPYYATVDYAKALHKKMMRRVHPDKSIASVLEMESEGQMRAMVGARLPLQEAKLLVHPLMMLNDPEEGQELPLSYVPDVPIGSEYGFTTVAQAVPIGFTPSTARSCAQELQQAVAQQLNKSVDEVEVLYATIQTLDSALTNESASDEPEMTYTLLTGLGGRMVDGQYPVPLQPRSLESLSWLEV